MLKKIVLLTLIGTVAYLVSGWLVFDFVLGSYTERNTTQVAGFKKAADQFSTPFLVLSCAAYAALIVFVLVVLTNTKSLLRGTAAASVIGVLVAIMADSFWLASSNFYSNPGVALADVGGAAISVGFLGFVITLFSGKIGD